MDTGENTEGTRLTALLLERQLATCYGGGTDDVTLATMQAAIVALTGMASEIMKRLSVIEQMLTVPSPLATPTQRALLAKHGLPSRVTADAAAVMIAGLNATKRKVKT